VIATIFPITFAMNEVLYAVVYVALIRGDIFYWGALMAAGLLVGLPLAILFMLYMDHFIRGLTGGSS